MIKDAFSEPYYCPKCGVFRKMEYYQTGKVICPFCVLSNFRRTFGNQLKISKMFLE